jgi:hypothetical protein
MRFTAVFSLGFAALICSAALNDGASAQSNPYALDRLFLDPDQIPFNDVLSFNSETAVENYFGLGSREASLASDFFAGYTGDSANMLFARFVPGGGRARIYGGNLSGLSQAQLQAINGTLSLTSEGYKFNASVNLASATSLASAAYRIQTALNAVQPTVATITGSSIAPGSASFTGSIETGVMDVTSVSAGRIAIGGTRRSPKPRRGSCFFSASYGSAWRGLGGGLRFEARIEIGRWGLLQHGREHSRRSLAVLSFGEPEAVWAPIAAGWCARARRSRRPARSGSPSACRA